MRLFPTPIFSYLIRTFYFNEANITFASSLGARDTVAFSLRYSQRNNCPFSPCEQRLTFFTHGVRF